LYVSATARSGGSKKWLVYPELRSYGWMDEWVCAVARRYLYRPAQRKVSSDRLVSRVVRPSYVCRWMTLLLKVG
jgi:hypothetical protein